MSIKYLWLGINEEKTIYVPKFDYLFSLFLLWILECIFCRCVHGRDKKQIIDKIFMWYYIQC